MHMARSIRGMAEKIRFVKDIEVEADKNEVNLKVI